MNNIMTHYLKKITHWLLPYTCVLCHSPSTRPQDLCEDCWRELPYLDNTCSRCANALNLIQHHSTQEIICGHCQTFPPAFNTTFALFAYQAPITKLIMNLKFGHTLSNARILGELLLENIRQNWYQDKDLPQVIIPVPLHPQRLKERGFNQALEIARPIAKYLSIPLELKACQRIKPTMAQATLPAKDREKNVKNAFIISNTLGYSHVAVIDDVITTGHTIQEFCRSLKLAGIKQIDVWCCARA